METDKVGCELLAFILYLCSLKQHINPNNSDNIGCELLAFILYLCSLKQRKKEYYFREASCELLAFILYLCSLKQPHLVENTSLQVVNCLHLSCIFAL